ncbi:hypothetical protein RND71_013241 [Anisodus tanguticus]|uniref:Uncharacterized protein n=1 Tax=Anisodus tanguticus TaxID=243964 RepID=A0AAE1SEU2_9SOLA|nr:hypothetical protein RND71_013241 [Anisodus tanguticus]
MQLRHEMSLCRVYVISSSFRAFDRRPVAPITTREPAKTVINQESAAISVKNVSKIEAISSPDESLAMEEQEYLNLHDDQVPVINEEISINYNNKRIKSDFYEPLSGWEQFN